MLMSVSSADANEVVLMLMEQLSNQLLKMVASVCRSVGGDDSV
jgi:hypothetical protein